MSEPAAWPASDTVETPEHPPIEATDRRDLAPEAGAVPGQSVPATEGPEDTWERSEAPASASPTMLAGDPDLLDPLDRRIRELEDEIRRLKSG